MHLIQNHEVMGFNTYQNFRQPIRSQMMAARRLRSVQLTKHIRLIFENKQTVRYQIEEVMYAARSSCRAEVDEQIATYQQLLPDGRQLKATLMLEYPDAEEARTRLGQMVGIENSIFLKVGRLERIWPSANEDIGGHTMVSPVHYLSYAFSVAMKQALLAGQSVSVGIQHPGMTTDPIMLNLDTCAQLAADLLVADQHKLDQP